MSAYWRDEVYRDTPYGTLLSGHFDYDDTYRLARPKGMNDWLIVYTIGGEGYFRTPAGEKRCGAGQVGLLRSGVPHEYGTVPGKRWNFIWIHFQTVPETGYLPDDEVLIQTFPDGFLQDRVHQSFRNVLHHSRERSEYWHALCENSIREALLLLAQRLERKRDPRIERALQWLSRSMKDDVRLEDLAQEVGLSVSRLSHLFKREMGVSITQHLNRMRLRQAALFMKHMGRSATEASQDVGFNNYNHFAELFRKLYGVSPRTYKNRAERQD